MPPEINALRAWHSWLSPQVLVPLHLPNQPYQCEVINLWPERIDCPVPLCVRFQVRTEVQCWRSLCPGLTSSPPTRPGVFELSACPRLLPMLETLLTGWASDRSALKQRYRYYTVLTPFLGLSNQLVRLVFEHQKHWFSQPNQKVPVFVFVIVDWMCIRKGTFF